MRPKKKMVREAYGVKITLEEKGREIGRAFLYVLWNAQHKRPFGLMEDVFVAEDRRDRGLGGQLVRAVIAEAKKRKCYKLIATSRHSKPKLRKYYRKFGFAVWGTEYRMDL